MGQILGGRFELLDVVGQGGMGTVWRVRDLRDGRVLAGKVLSQSDAGSLMRFMREMTTRISHEHIVMPLSWAGEDDRVVFSMPLVTGGSLEDLHREYGALPPLFAAEIIRQVMSALEAVHTERFVHRDVKPPNVLLYATGRGRPCAMLTDFGIAAELEGPRLTSASMVLGTPGYLAPEALRGAEPHPLQDIFAAGAVLYYMLTGNRPPNNGYLADADADAPHHGRVPAKLWNLTRWMLSWNPQDRPQSAAHVLAALAEPELLWQPGSIGEVNVTRRIEPSAPTAMPTEAVGTPTSWSADAPGHESGTLRATLAATSADPVASWEEAGALASPAAKAPSAPVADAAPDRGPVPTVPHDPFAAPESPRGFPAPPLLHPATAAVPASASPDLASPDPASPDAANTDLASPDPASPAPTSPPTPPTPPTRHAVVNVGPTLVTPPVGDPDVLSVDTSHLQRFTPSGQKQNAQPPAPELPDPEPSADHAAPQPSGRGVQPGLSTRVIAGAVVGVLVLVVGGYLAVLMLDKSGHTITGERKKPPQVTVTVTPSKTQPAKPKPAASTTQPVAPTTPTAPAVPTLSSLTMDPKWSTPIRPVIFAEGESCPEGVEGIEVNRNDKRLKCTKVNDTYVWKVKE